MTKLQSNLSPPLPPKSMCTSVYSLLDVQCTSNTHIAGQRVKNTLVFVVIICTHVFLFPLLWCVLWLCSRSRKDGKITQGEWTCDVCWITDTSRVWLWLRNCFGVQCLLLVYSRVCCVRLSSAVLTKVFYCSWLGISSGSLWLRLQLGWSLCCVLLVLIVLT